MEEHPPLSELLAFPCDYVFKAFGPAEDEAVFAQAVHQAVCSVTPVPLDALRSRSSSGGRYLCVTILVRLHDMAQLEAIYAALKRVENLQYLL